MIEYSRLMCKLFSIFGYFDRNCETFSVIHWKFRSMTVKISVHFLFLKAHGLGK